MKIKAKTKDGEIVTIIGTQTEYNFWSVACIKADGKIFFYSASFLTVIDEEYLPKEGEQ